MKLKQKQKIKRKQKLRKYWPLYLLLAPAVIYLIIFNYGPMYGVQIAFKDYRASKGIWGSEWVGLKHFIRFVTYPNFWKLIKNTLSINLLGMCMFPISVILALSLNEVPWPKFKKTVQMLTYAPYFLSVVVLCGMVTMFVSRDGLIGQLYGLITGEPTNLLGKAEYFPWIYVLSNVWQSTGWGTILYLSALAGISPELVEAAKIDGATRMQVIWHVNIPGILPVVIMTFIMSTGNMLSVGFDKIFLLQNQLNMETSEVIASYTYQIGLVGGQFSYSSAIGLFNTAVNLAVLLLVNKIVKMLSGTGIW